MRAAILASLDDDKAEAVVVMSLAGKSSIADYLIIASGRSTRHVGAITEHLRERLKARGGAPRIEGVPQCHWVLVDADDIIVHLFQPEGARLLQPGEAVVGRVAGRPGDGVRTRRALACASRSRRSAACAPAPSRRSMTSMRGGCHGPYPCTRWPRRKPRTPANAASARRERCSSSCPSAPSPSALDESGEPLSSRAFADRLARWRDDGRDLAFLIGGADGHGEAVLARADLVLSLGAMTWPHLLVRALLAEQLYRAHAILSHHPYHRS